MVKIKFEKLTNVQLPCKAHSTDAGIDFYIPTDLSYVCQKGKNINIGLYTTSVNAQETVSQTAIAIRPGESILIPMGIKSHFEHGYALVFFNRSGIAAKRHLLRGSCIVDADYTGEIFINLNNVSGNTQYLLPGEKLIQGMLLPVFDVEIEEGSTDRETARGDGGFGSSDK